MISTILSYDASDKQMVKMDMVRYNNDATTTIINSGWYMYDSTLDRIVEKEKRIVKEHAKMDGAHAIGLIIYTFVENGVTLLSIPFYCYTVYNNSVLFDDATAIKSLYN